MTKDASPSRPRIAIVVGDAGIPILGDKGAAVHVRAMADALVERGQDVVVVAARRGEGPNALTAPVVEARLPADARAVLGGGSAAGEGAGELGEVGRLLLSRAIEDKLVALHAERPLAAIYERLSLWSYAGVAAGRRFGVPVLIEANARLVAEQGRYRSLRLNGLAEGVERHVLGRADAVLAVSRPLADELIGAGARPERVHVMPNGVDPARFYPGLDGRAARADWGVGDDEVVVGFVGSLKPWHGVADLIAAVGRLDDAKVRLVVVGEGPERERCAAVAAGVAVPVVFTGALPHDRVPGAMAGFDIAVAPYAGGAPSYFSPLKAFEYAAAGRAIVAAGGGQIAALFPVDAVVLYQPGDVDGMAAALAALAADPGRRRALGAAAARFVRERHTWDRNAARVTELIGDLRARRDATWAA